MNSEFFDDLYQQVSLLKNWHEHFGPIKWFQNFEEIKDIDFKLLWVTSGIGDEYLVPLDPKVFGRWITDSTNTPRWVEGTHSILSQDDFEPDAQFCLSSHPWREDEKLQPAMRIQADCPNCNYDESEIDQDDCMKCDGQGSLDINTNILEMLIPFVSKSDIQKNFFKIYQSES